MLQCSPTTDQSILPLEALEYLPPSIFMWAYLELKTLVKLRPNVGLNGAQAQQNDQAFHKGP